MKNLTQRFFAPLLVFLCFTSCEQLEEYLDFSGMTTQEALASDRKVKFIAQNFYRSMPSQDVEAVRQAIITLTAAEVDEFIDLDYDRRIRAGEDQDDTKLFQAFRRAAHRAAGERHQRSMFQLSDAEYRVISDELLASGDYDRLIELDLQPNLSGRQMACTGGNWNSTGTISVGNAGSGEVQWGPMTYEGSVAICPASGSCQDDCDLLFQSRLYNQYYFSSNIQGTTAAAQGVLTYSGATAHFSRRIAPNSSEEFLQMATGTRRVQLYYGFGNADVFASQLQTGLVVR